jgi:hypothetical protein
MGIQYSMQVKKRVIIQRSEFHNLTAKSAGEHGRSSDERSCEKQYLERWRWHIVGPFLLLHELFRCVFDLHLEADLCLTLWYISTM